MLPHGTLAKPEKGSATRRERFTDYRPKFSKFPGGKSQAEERREAKQASQAQLEASWRIVDVRDGGRCRICGRPCRPGALQRNERAERHHIVPRSLGGPHTPENLLTVCLAECHPALHQSGTLRVSGNAETRKESGRLCGVLVERVVRDCWQVVGWR